MDQLSHFGMVFQTQAEARISDKIDELPTVFVSRQHAAISG